MHHKHRKNRCQGHSSNFWCQVEPIQRGRSSLRRPRAPCPSFCHLGPRSGVEWVSGGVTSLEQPRTPCQDASCGIVLLCQPLLALSSSLPGQPVNLPHSGRQRSRREHRAGSPGPRASFFNPPPKALGLLSSPCVRAAARGPNDAVHASPLASAMAGLRWGTKC